MARMNPLLGFVTLKKCQVWRRALSLTLTQYHAKWDHSFSVQPSSTLGGTFASQATYIGLR
jgi:hypothetical protein